MAIELTKTRAEVVAMAADELGIVGAGQSLDDEDREKIDSRFDGLAVELQVRDACYIASEDEIPAEWTGILALLLANENAGTFGKSRMSKDTRDALIDDLKILTRRNEPANRFLQMDNALRHLGGHYTLNRWTNDL